MNRKLLVLITIILCYSTLYAQDKINLHVKGLKVDRTKQYDGTAEAHWQKDNFDVEGLEDGDELNSDVIVNFTVEYDDAQPGTNKIITVKFSLSGPKADKYEIYNIVIDNATITYKSDPWFNPVSSNQYGAKLGTDIGFDIEYAEKYDFEYQLDGKDTPIGTVIPIGQHTISCNIKAKSEAYTDATPPPQEITIYKKRISLEMAPNAVCKDTKTYDGTNIADATNPYYIISDKDNVLVEGDDIDLESICLYNAIEPGSGHSIHCYNSLIGKDKDKYEIDDPDLFDILIIETASITPIVLNLLPLSGTYTYGQSAIGTDIVAKTSDETISGVMTYRLKQPGSGYIELGRGSMLKPGENTLFISFQPDDNEHYIALTPATEPVITVTPKEIDFEGVVKLRSKIKDGTTTISASQVIDPLPSLTGVLDGDNVRLAIDLAKTKYPSAATGNYEIDVYLKLTGQDAGNYKLKNSVTKTKTSISSFEYQYNVTPIDLAPKTFNLIYNNTVLGEDLKVTNALKDNQSVVYKINNNTVSSAPLLPGSYNVAVLCYEHNTEVNREDIVVNVLPREIEFEDDFKVVSKYFDNSDIVYKGEVIVPQITNLVEGDVIKIEIDYDNTRFESSEIGEQKVNIYYSLSGKDSDKYKLKNNKTAVKSEIMELKAETNIQPDADNVYKLVYTKSALGKDLKIDIKLNENEEVKYFINDNDCTGSMLFAGDYAVTAMFYQFKEKIAEYQMNVNVEPLKLIMSEPEISHQKIYDGSNEAPLTGSLSVFTNKLDTDNDIVLDTQKALFNDAMPGTNKTITVSFTLKGDYKDKYLPPDDIVYTDGIITPGEIKITDLQFDKTDFCQTDHAVLSFKITSGFPEKVKVSFNDQAHQNGFADFETTEMTDKSDNIKTLTIDIPENAAYGTYHGEVILVDAVGTESAKQQFDIAVNFPSTYILSKFTDVVFINNAENRFSQYQWYKNGDKINGATEQFYNDKQGINGLYSAVVVFDGKSIKICPAQLNVEVSTTKSLAKSAILYPNPASALQPINIKLQNFDQDDIHSASLVIFNSLGNKVLQRQNLTEEFTITLPKGSYTVSIIYGIHKLSYKIIVNN